MDESHLSYAYLVTFNHTLLSVVYIGLPLLFKGFVAVCVYPLYDRVFFIT